MNQLKISQYCIDNGLAIYNDHKMNLIPKLVEGTATWSLGKYYEIDAQLYLAMAIYFAHYYGELGAIEFGIDKDENDNFLINVYETDRKNSNVSHKWFNAIEVLNELEPFMAGSNVSYLSSQLFYTGVLE